jgi:NADH:ubiquinone oxidoreductase subunit K
MVIAAAESAIGLAIILSVFRSIASVETTDAGELKW